MHTVHVAHPAHEGPAMTPNAYWRCGIYRVAGLPSVVPFQMTQQEWGLWHAEAKDELQCPDMSQP